MENIKKQNLFLGLVIVITLLLGFLIGSNFSKSTIQTQNVNVNDILKGKDFKINLNTSTEKELCLIPYIGEKTAKKIIEYREEKKGFSTVTEILNIKGINRKIYENIKERLEV